MTITEKVAYLRGLFEGMSVDESTNEGKLFKAVIDVLDDMAYSIADVEDGMDELNEQIEAIDEDLDELEQDFYGEDEDAEDDEEIYEITCPSCNEKICLDFDMLADGEIECPNCGEHLEFDLDECGCGCEECAGCEEEDHH
ncbi:MAG: hypothetical protein HFG26_01660 [Provencibacterium sp.]|jgi:hypothetical protein|nr:hypothetical protein [Provencibacterium sp.]